MRLRTVLAALAVLAVSAPLRANTYTVTNTADTGAGSLRQAITDANANPGADTIQFNIPGSDPNCDAGGVCTITPSASGLPVITDAVTIDGYTQPGSAVNTSATGTNAVLKIVLSGTNGNSDGLNLEANSITIRGLVIGGGFLDGIGGAFLTDIKIIGCFIGVDATGNTAFPNARQGIYITPADGLTIGGTALADRNVVSGNQNIGIAVGLGALTGSIVVQGNLIGTNAAGTAAIPNNDGMTTDTNGLGGTYTIGGSAANAGNVFSGNNARGLFIGGFGTGTAFTVQGNLIGTDATGTLPLPNGNIGMHTGLNGAVIGGVGAGEGNVVAYNLGGGVVNDFGNTNVSIRGNSIHDNGFGAQGHGVGLDLSGAIGGDGVTPNDSGDGDTGSNNFQNFPIIASAAPLSPSSGTHVTGVLHSTPSTTYDLDFYSNPACIPHPHDYLQGLIYLGSGQVTTDGSGTGSFSIDVAGTIQPGERVSGTATDPSGNTSEFSQRMPFYIVPASGDPAGGAAVTITGTDFLAGATVTIGGVAATGVNVGSFNSLTANAPALPPGSLNDVVVTDTDGATGKLEAGYVANFLDVPSSQQFYTYVTTLVTSKITVGVGGGNYGVDAPTLRQQMAVFILKAEHGLCYTPPPCTGIFPDVPCSSNFAPWIEAMFNEGITGGCGGGNFCPTNPVRRDQMAVFLLKGEHGSSYVPPTCTGIFLDVPCPSTFANWIEQLAAEMITGGCGGGNYCPSSNNTRGQMAVFITKTFHLQ
ncbi:MAG TPA: IPT/TIG domain-containing protein [Thermoanaerobaculia bacterium]|nr:IPT/TIG domain-containing protein [Thermoanaerobaculia bacterium]